MLEKTLLNKDVKVLLIDGSTTWEGKLVRIDPFHYVLYDEEDKFAFIRKKSVSWIEEQ